jgi:hypothetical protein
LFGANAPNHPQRFYRLLRHVVGGDQDQSGLWKQRPFLFGRVIIL